MAECTSGGDASPVRPVRLFSVGEDPSVRQLLVQSTDQVGLLFKLCELLGSHGVDIGSADISVKDGIVHNEFNLHVARPSDFADASDWCQELEDFLQRSSASGAGILEVGSLSSVSRRLSVNPDLLSVVAFHEIPLEGDDSCDEHSSPSFRSSSQSPPRAPGEFRYRLELEGINQAGLLTYASFVFYFCGFSVVWARISTVEGRVSDSFELSTTSAEAEQRLRTHFDVPMEKPGKDSISLPFHVTRSDGELLALMSACSNGGFAVSPVSMSPIRSPRDSAASSPFFDAGGGPEHEGQMKPRSRLISAFSENEDTSASAAAAVGCGACASTPAPVAISSLKSLAPPLEAGEEVRRTSKGPVCSDCRRPSKGSRAPSPQPGETTKDPRLKDGHSMSVNFSNGDTYDGNCVLFDAGEKRHGYGVYTYSSGSHETYRQYRGQWREDKKHGFGVLLYRNGGAYVGQWEANQKHGLGVLLDTAAGSDPSSMPGFRYEGQWFEDEPHGLGTEESDTSSYFGRFVHGKRSERGVSMKFAKLGLHGCEACDGSTRTPLLEALEVALAQLRRPGESSTPSTCTARRTSGADAANVDSRHVPVADPALERGAATYHSGQGGLQARTPVAGLAFSQTFRPGTRPRIVTNDSQTGSNSSKTNSGGTATPLPLRPLQGSRSASETSGGTEQFAGMQRKRSEGSSSSSRRSQAVPETLDGASASAGSARSGDTGGNCGDGEAMSDAHSRAPSGIAPAAHSSNDVLEVVPRTPVVTRQQSGTSSGDDGGFVLSLLEENNLISPRDSTTQLGRSPPRGPQTEDLAASSMSKATAAALSRKTSIPDAVQEEAEEEEEPTDGRLRYSFRRGSRTGMELDPHSPALLASPEQILLGSSLPDGASSPRGADAAMEATRGLGGHLQASRRWLAAAKAAQSGDGKVPEKLGSSSSSRDPQSTHASAHKAAGMALLEGAKAAKAASSASTSVHPEVSMTRIRSSPIESAALAEPPMQSPMLWSEDEIAAFIACLGISKDVCAKVRQCKVKGVRHFLEMSNTEMRRDFGLASPVERLTVRQALKRLLDADRWENRIRGHRVGDVLNDTVLSRYIVPMEELSLLAKISQGGYGTVYRGVLEPKTSRSGLQANKSHLVAVKEMRGEKRVRLYELLKEACVMASLNHPNICTFLGVCTDKSHVGADRKDYIISQLMDCSLFDLVHQPFKLRWHGELTVRVVVSLTTGIASGIVYLHGKNLVHADLKSSNILIDYSSTWQLLPRICDFGHAAVRTFPAPHHRCGTPHWAAPEVLRGEALGTAADIYSIGVIMWEMLTHELPHKGLSFSQVLAAVGWAGLTPNLSLLPEEPSDLRRLVKSCLSFTPTERPTSKDLQRRLRHVPKKARSKTLLMLAGFLDMVCDSRPRKKSST